MVAKRKTTTKKGCGCAAKNPKTVGKFGSPRTVTIIKNLTWGGEYRVPGKNGTEASAYYTEDKEDAVLTAKHMHGDGAVIKFRTIRS